MKCLVCSKLFREGFRQGEEFRDELLLESKKTKRENNAIFYPKVQYKNKEQESSRGQRSPWPPWLYCQGHGVDPDYGAKQFTHMDVVFGEGLMGKLSAHLL